jgi:hypothetical protein
MPIEKVNLVLTEKAIASLRESDFDTSSAVGEVIDNSIQAGATEVNVLAGEIELPARGRRQTGSTQITELAFGDDWLWHGQRHVAALFATRLFHSLR